MTCEMNVSGVIFFPSRAKQAKKQKIIIIMPDLRIYVSELIICKRSERLKHPLQSHLNETSQHQVAIQ